MSKQLTINKKLLSIILILAVLLNATPSYAKTRWVTITEKHYKYLGVFYCTHYCPCSRCCGKGGGKVTASGTKPTAGRTVGVNPRLIPYGTHLQIGKTKGYVAEDTGGGIGWYHLDVFCNSHQEALQKGVQHKKVYAITYKKVKVKMVLNKAKAIKIKNKMKTYLEVK